ncbi:hypothetical protein PBI_FLOOF_73 [Microbacterium phage Floof]|uniref:Uncharacterized protein n=1 Tax=Microbacterium phage Floof TaxID=2201433 RepID=A0A2Z4Q5S7_9CAUD|nr:hypothetical protein PBI_FLOOF_73 [Microbacterium phage Floof]
MTTDPVRDDLRDRLTTEARPIRVEAVDARDRPYSRGIIITVQASANTSMSLEINAPEALALRDALHTFISALPDSELHPEDQT